MTTSTNDSTLRLCEHLRANAEQYFPHFGGNSVAVDIVSTSRRRYSVTFLLRIHNATTERFVFAKQPLDAPPLRQSATETQSDRPRLIPLLSAAEETKLEHAALVRMGDHFAALGDDQLGVPRVLAIIDDQTMLVEALRLPTLDRCLAKNYAPAACHSAGAWLRSFHALPPAATDRCSLSTSEQISERLELLCDYVAKSCSGTFDFNALQSLLQRALHAADSSDIDACLTHGDFGPHNLFVAPAQGVIGFDTLAHWRMPPAVDLAYFLLLLETIPPLFVSRRWQLRPMTVTELRRAFLAGYFGPDCAPPASLLIFEVLTTLDKWASVIQSRRRAHGLRGLLKQTRLTFQQHWLQSRLRKQHDQLAEQRATCNARPQLAVSGSNG